MSNEVNINALVEDINPADWFETRFLTRIPDHFIRCKMGEDTNRVELIEWLERYTQGRFALGTDVEDRRAFIVNTANVIAFENPEEATLFTLAHR